MNYDVLPKSEAVQQAKTCMLLLGKTGWKARYWTNTRPAYFHWIVYNGPISVSPRYESRGKILYTCMVSHHLEGSCGGSSNWTPSGDIGGFDDPKDAVRTAVAHVENFVAHVTEIQTFVQGVRDRFPVPPVRKRKSKIA